MNHGCAPLKNYLNNKHEDGKKERTARGALPGQQRQPVALPVVYEDTCFRCLVAKALVVLLTALRLMTHKCAALTDLGFQTKLSLTKSAH